MCSVKRRELGVVDLRRRHHRQEHGHIPTALAGPPAPRCAVGSPGAPPELESRAGRSGDDKDSGDNDHPDTQEQERIYAGAAAPYLTDDAGQQH
jgi:hypothetical protein